MRLFLLHSLLLNPMAEAGLGTPPPAQGQQQAPPPPTAPPAEPMVPLTIAEYQRLRSLEGQFAQFQADKAAEIQAKEQERIKALADKGQVEQALELQRTGWESKFNEATTRYSELERQVFSERKANVITQAFAGRTFAGESPEHQASTANQVRSLLEGQFETVRDATGALLVRDRISGRPAADVVREHLDSPNFRHFFAASGRAGSGALGNSTTSPAAGNGPQPGSLEHLAAEFQARQNHYGAMGLHGIPKPIQSSTNPFIR